MREEWHASGARGKSAQLRGQSWKLQAREQAMSRVARQLTRLGEKGLLVEPACEDLVPRNELGDLKIGCFASLGCGAKEIGNKQHRKMLSKDVFGQLVLQEQSMYHWRRGRTASCQALKTGCNGWLNVWRRFRPRRLS